MNGAEHCVKTHPSTTPDFCPGSYIILAYTDVVLPKADDGEALVPPRLLKAFDRESLLTSV